MFYFTLKNNKKINTEKIRSLEKNIIDLNAKIMMCENNLNNIQVDLKILMSNVNKILIKLGAAE